MDESCIIRFPGSSRVYVCVPRKVTKPDDYRKDNPPGEPPELHGISGFSEYFPALSEAKDGSKLIYSEYRDWLIAIEERVKELQDY